MAPTPGSTITITVTADAGIINLLPMPSGVVTRGNGPDGRRQGHLMLKARRARRDERGAVAVIWAVLLFLVIIPMAALGTDIGNAVARKTVTQTQADFAALDDGQQITDNPAAGTTPSTAIVNAVVASLNGNQPQDDVQQLCAKAKTCVSANRRDNLDNGEGPLHR